MITSENRQAWQAIADSCEAKRPSAGKLVRVSSGKHSGETGIVTWHGIDRFADTRFQTDAQLQMRDMMGTFGFRVRVQPESGTAFFVSADKVEVIAEVKRVEFEFNADCPICLRGRSHTLAEHEAALRRSYEIGDEPEGDL